MKLLRLATSLKLWMHLFPITTLCPRCVKRHNHPSYSQRKMPSKAMINGDLHNSTIQSTFSYLGGDDVNERLKQLRARNKTLKDERDQIGHEYDGIKFQLEKSEADRKQLLGERER